MVKKKIISIPYLRHFDPSRPAILETNAFDKMTGGIFFQKDDKRVLHFVVFYNKTFGPAEINYHIYNKELLAIIKCFEHWRPELENTEMFIQTFTDYEALLTFAKKDPKYLFKRQIK